MNARISTDTDFADTAERDGGTTRRILVLLVSIAVLLVMIGMSLAIGARNIALVDVVGTFVSSSADVADQETIFSLRLPRTILGLIAGVGFALSGALMQALTRNPLADPGILGINAGAAFAMVVAIGVLGLTQPLSLIWFAFAGTGLTALAVYFAASGTRGGVTPLRLTLAGVAIGAILRGLTSALIFLDPRTFEHMLNWEVGSLVATGYESILVTGPFIVIGVIVALSLAPALNVIGLGDDAARSLGARVGLVRALVVMAVMLLTGAATAAAGPLGFLGLMVPHAARWLAGSDQRWIFAYTLVLAPIVLLGADVLGRLSMRPAEIQVGVVLAFVGAPVLIWLVRARKVSAL